MNARGPRDAAGIGMTSQRTRSRMVERLREQGIRDERVLAAMGAVPRHLFVDEALASRAYEDTALPIGFSQTISQPYVVARMIESLIGDNGMPARVLEVGTGCGYQAAVLAQLVSEVYSVERIHALLERARANLRSLRLSNLRLSHGDGALDQIAEIHRQMAKGEVYRGYRSVPLAMSAAMGLTAAWLQPPALGAADIRAMQQVEMVYAPAVALEGKSWQQGR